MEERRSGVEQRGREKGIERFGDLGKESVVGSGNSCQDAQSDLVWEVRDQVSRWFGGCGRHSQVKAGVFRRFDFSVVNSAASLYYI